MNATSSHPAASGLFWKMGLVVFLAVLLLAVPQAALLPLLDRDEPRFAEASREMIESGNYIVPTFNHAPRYAKPPLIYWCQTAAYRVFGENAFAARLPSLLATAGTALLLFAWGAQLGSEQVGLGAALSYAFCLQTVQQGRVATADALLIFFMTPTAFAGWKILNRQAEEIVPHGQRKWRYYLWDAVLALGFAGGFLAKGPEALLPFLPLLFCARSSKLRMELTVDFLLGLVIVLFWAIPAYIETNGDYWRVGMSEGVGERMVAGLQGHGASSVGWYLLGVPLYLLLFWLSALPWSPLLIAHRRKLFAGWKPDATDTYLLLNAGLVFLIFSLMVTKLPHYTLPAFPFIALLFARRLKSAGLSPGYLTELGWIAGFSIAFLTTILIPIALANNATPSPVGVLVRAAGDTLAPETEFAQVDFREPSGVWEMRRVTQKYGELISESDALEFLDQPGPRALVISTARWRVLTISNERAGSDWKTYEARGWNNAKGAFIDLTLVVKP